MHNTRDWAHLSFHRLIEVIHADNNLHLVFEFLDQDLKKYMDSTPMMEPLLVKVVAITPALCISLM